ncbi:MAG: sel1 repeat family protein [Erysipelotrichaceae bacterium]|nr:sel1 repeat family protein [Erysipelotrichaceae bacterium]
MNIWEAKSRVNQLAGKSHLTEEEEFELTESLQYLIETTGDYSYAEWLGGIYYQKKIYDLALKYYELAETLGSNWVGNGLGYIWYYGRTGQVDYQKAYKYFTMTAENRKADKHDRIEATFKLADMHKNGYYVEKSWDRYVEIIEDLYEEVKDDPYMPRPEVFTRLASIRTGQGREDEAIEMYLTAKTDLAWRLGNNRFFGDLNRIKWLVNDLYKLIEFDPTDFDLYDLYYLLNKEHTVSFEIEGSTHEIESRQDEEMNIRFDDRWYRNIDDFFLQALIGEETIEAAAWMMDDWRILK